CRLRHVDIDVNDRLRAVAGRRDARVLKLLPVGIFDRLGDLPRLGEGRTAHQGPLSSSIWGEALSGVARRSWPAGESGRMESSVARIVGENDTGCVSAAQCARRPEPPALTSADYMDKGRRMQTVSAAVPRLRHPQVSPARDFDCAEDGKALE